MAISNSGFKRKRRKSNTKRKATSRKRAKFRAAKRPGMRKNVATVLSHNTGLLAPTKTVNMRYTQTVAIGGGTGVQTHMLTPNSIFDPDVSGGGHQPRGHDQMAAYYDKYRVLSCKVKITFVPKFANSAGVGPTLVWCIPVDSVPEANLIDQNGVMERFPGFYKIMVDQSKPQIIEYDWKGASWFDKSDWGSEFTQSFFGANPSKTAKISFGSVNLEDSLIINQNALLLANIDLTYKVRLLDPKPVEIS